MPDPNSAHSDVIDLINTFKWPVIVLICFIFLTVYLKKHIISLFSKSKKLSFEGAGMKFETTQESGVSIQEKDVQENRKTSILEKSTKIFRIETINMFKEYVQQETNYEEMRTDTEKYETLLNYSTMLYIIKQFDLIYDGIFGSQIALMQFIIAKGSQDMDIFEHYYNQAKEKYKVEYENFDLDKYPKFLFSYNLLIVDKDQKVQITILGLDFIKYLTDARKNIYKDF